MSHDDHVMSCIICTNFYLQIVAVCDFYTFIGYIQKGIIKKERMSVSMNGWMDGWMDGWMEGWMDGWMDG